jgi:hypothetical protein
MLSTYWGFVLCRSKEEAIAPELKKGVKMSVHHSRDTAHKQWSETRVIALRGLARVLRTCTRLLLQEAWFQVIWTDALAVCQGALQAACDEQEVSIAALDVVFTMLQIIIQADVTGPAVIGLAASELAAPIPNMSGKQKSAKSNASGSASAAAQPSTPTMSKEEVEHIERCKHTLWQLTWAAVRNTAFFPCNSVELALAIAQKLKELYRSRLEHEFRYSDNVRVLLEILVALVRPRVGLLRVNQHASGQLTADGIAAVDSTAEAGKSAYYALPDQIAQKQDRVAESQLQRSVMELLTTIQPTDGLAQSCLLSTLTEICFSALWVQVPVSAQSVSLLRGEEGDPLTVNSGSGPANAGSQDEDCVLILGAAPDRLRKEAAEQLTLLLQLQPAPADSGSADPGTPRSSKLFPWATPTPAFLSLVLDIVVRRFVADICEGPLLVRSTHACPLHTSASDASQVTPVRRNSKADTTRERTGSSAPVKGGGFFASFGSIMSPFSNATTHALQPVYPKHAPTSAAGNAALTSARIAGGTLHKFAKYLSALDGRMALPDCTPSSLHLRGVAQSPWRTFYLVDSDVKLLLTALQVGYTLLSSPQPEVKQQPPRSTGSAAAGSAKSSHSDGAGAGSGAANVEVITEAVWSSVLTATACLLSPWQAYELCAKEAGEFNAAGGSLKDGNTSPATTAAAGRVSSAADIAAILRVSLQIIDYLKYS